MSGGRCTGQALARLAHAGTTLELIPQMAVPPA
jgi:hypothetical protein